MEVPPAYPNMPPPRKSNSKLIWGIVIAVVSVCCIGIGVVGFLGWKAVQKMMPMLSCGQRFEDIDAAVQHYAAGHGGNLPNAKTWEDDVQPDLAQVMAAVGSGKRPFGSVAPGTVFSCTLDGAQTGIAFNSDLSGKKLDDIKDKSKEVLLFEIRTAVKNSNEPYKPRTDSPSEIMGVPRGWFRARADGSVRVQLGADQDMIFDPIKPRSGPHEEP